MEVTVEQTHPGVVEDENGQGTGRHSTKPMRIGLLPMTSRNTTTHSWKHIPLHYMKSNYIFEEQPLSALLNQSAGTPLRVNLQLMGAAHIYTQTMAQHIRLGF